MVPAIQKEPKNSAIAKEVRADRISRKEERLQSQR